MTEYSADEKGRCSACFRTLPPWQKSYGGHEYSPYLDGEKRQSVYHQGAL